MAVARIARNTGSDGDFSTRQSEKRVTMVGENPVPSVGRASRGPSRPIDLPEASRWIPVDHASRLSLY